MTYPETLTYLYGLQRTGIRMGLETVSRLLDGLGNPHRRFASVHVAGTNGKGSTAAVIASVLRAAGCRVGLYTSPHLRRFNERIQVNGTLIADVQVVRLAQRLRRVAEEAGLHPTFFEFTTAMAFAHFAESGVDVAVVEVGLGGRLDATNVLRPCVSVVTEIARDHEEYLGHSLEAIAREKAGIVKPRVPVVTTATDPGALRVISETCAARQAPLSLLGRDFHAEAVVPGLWGTRLSYRGLEVRLEEAFFNLAGRHQAGNAAGALAALEILRAQGFPVSEAAMRRGLAEVQWPGRLQVLPGTPPVLLDGAHNPAGAGALGAALRELRPLGSGDLFLVLGILDDKPVEEMVRVLAPLARWVIATRPDTPRAADPERIAAAARETASGVRVCGTVAEALAWARTWARSHDWICVTGSLYTVGEAFEAVSDLSARQAVPAGAR